MSNPELKVIHRLIRRVGCAFYEVKDRILLDALLKHSTLRDDHLSMIMDMQLKEVRRICGGLKENRMIDEYHSRMDTREGYSRPFGRTYYYINYRTTIDVIKWKIHKLVKTVGDRMRKDFDTKGYICQVCMRQYTSLDAVSLVSPDAMNFLCMDCGAVLDDNEENYEVKDDQERLSRLMSQMSKIISSLKEVDEIVVPENTFIIAIANAIPPDLDSIPSSEYLEPAPINTVTTSTVFQPTTPEPSILIDFDMELKSMTKDFGKKEKQVFSPAENDLPIWHSQSTIMNDFIDTDNIYKNMNSEDYLDFQNTSLKDNVSKKEKPEAIENAVAEYYAKLRAKKNTEIKDEIKDETKDLDYDDFDNDFEDVDGLEIGSFSNDDDLELQKHHYDANGLEK
ncbi:hypothetical protein T552_01187 [Pneumocystis carinii B80]|uniref:HTH TFE/IIEalpha-type domain-containing protein n=1 Tax=Pneumocystis carinii (strain B80) TaxID=1408658 RepID=A0A0W4ZLJ1_PNEC8|nr:hypothetical protein T552_01187 [Pneumocystis carinii B80]KTW29231.1 hypothetical protein T552_01187 [Pneumocystis carinii B80]